LTGRERECLAWTVIGKTAWEIGMILSISERTAHQHVQSAARKLGTASKHQAALVALRMGWIRGGDGHFVGPASAGPTTG
jgi:DNA-binding CsgD family transcriptional regulator